MKKNVLLLLLPLYFLNIQSQETDMLSGNPEWGYDSYVSERFWPPLGPGFKIDDERFAPVEKNGKTYHKIFLVSTEYNDTYGEVLIMEEPPVLVRESGGKVYADYDSYLAFTDDMKPKVEGELPFLVTKEGEILLYDFTVEKGDRYPSAEASAPIYVSNVSTVTVSDGTERKLISLDNGYQLLEGVGCLNSMLLNYLYSSGHWLQDGDGHAIHYELGLYSKYGKEVYMSEWRMANKWCATPTIAYVNGKLVFSCETPGAECVYEIKCADEGSGRGSEVSLNRTYEIRVHATLDGWQDSDVAVATIGWRDGRPVMEGFSSVTLDGDGSADVNGDGKVDVADIAKVIDSMAGQTRK